MFSAVVGFVWNLLEPSFLQNTNYEHRIRRLHVSQSRKPPSSSRVDCFTACSYRQTHVGHIAKNPIRVVSIAAIGVSFIWTAASF